MSTNVSLLAQGPLPTKFGKFIFSLYEEVGNHERVQHISLHMGDMTTQKSLLLRIQSACITGETFFASNCDCAAQIEKAISMIAEECRGIVIWLQQEGRGNGLLEKIRTLPLQDKGIDPASAFEQLGLPADQRQYNAAASILEILGIKQAQHILLLTNNPRKIEGLAKSGFQNIKRVPLIVQPTEDNIIDFISKRDKLGHWLPSE